MADKHSYEVALAVKIIEDMNPDEAKEVLLCVAAGKANVFECLVCQKQEPEPEPKKAIKRKKRRTKAQIAEAKKLEELQKPA